MRIVFMGTPEFAVPSLQALLDEGYDVAAVFTQPDKPKGRGYQLAAPPVKVLAQECGIPVYQPVKMRDGTVAAQLRELAPDLIVVVAYGRILPKEILEIPPMGCINVHGSLLPKYRGAGPIQWAVINGETETGVTTMYMGEGLDTGDMLLKEVMPIGPAETSDELHDRMMVVGASCLKETVKGLLAGALTPVPQKDEDATFAPLLDKKLARLDFTQSAQTLHNLVRGLYSWPMATTMLDGKLLKIHRAQVAEGYQGEPGMVLADDRFIVGCGQGALELLEVQLAGAKRMPAAEFMRGRRINIGSRVTDLS